MWEDVKKQCPDWLEDPEIYSLYDLTRVNSGELFQLLRRIVTSGMNHIIHCEVKENFSKTYSSFLTVF